MENIALSFSYPKEWHSAIQSLIPHEYLMLGEAIRDMVKTYLPQLKSDQLFYFPAKECHMTKFALSATMYKRVMSFGLDHARQIILNCMRLYLIDRKMIKNELRQKLIIDNGEAIRGQSTPESKIVKTARQKSKMKSTKKRD
jgi:hypothetical protein